MNNDSADNLPSTVDYTPTIDPELVDLVSEWQYAKIKFTRLWAQHGLKVEFILILGLLAVLFAVPYTMWFRSWTSNGSMQLYAPVVIPLVFAWIWLARYRLVVPEVEPIRRALREERHSRSERKKPGERDDTVLDILVKGKPIPDRRSSWLLYLACGLDIFAVWLREPSIMCLGFVLTVGGVVLFRHGRFTLRAALFPFLLLFTMIPLPGIMHDAIQDRIQPVILNNVVHTLTNSGTSAELPPEGAPIKITMRGQTYRLFADRAGTCVSEAIFVLILTAFYLSLMRVRIPLLKVGAMTLSVIWVSVLLVGRLIILCMIATYDRDMAMFVEGVSRIAYLLLALGGAYLITKGFKCVKLHRWVSFSPRSW